MRKSLFFLLLMSLPFLVRAQRYLGVATGNWGGTTNLYLNPAHIADSRHKVVVDLFSLNFGIDNSAAQINSGKAIERFLSDDSSTNFNNVFNFKRTDKLSLMAPYAEVRGPGVMVSINNKHSVALTTRFRAFNQAHDFDQQLYRTIKDPNFGATVGDFSLKAEPFNYTAHAWTEIGLSYAGVVWEQDIHQIKGGLSLRYLKGAGYLSLVNENMDVNYKVFNDNLTITNTNIRFASNLANQGFGDIANEFFSGAGSGLGADFGVVYEWRPNTSQYNYEMDGTTHTDRSQNMYKLRAAVSVIDIGSVKYSSANNKTVEIRGTGTVKASELGQNIDNYNDLKNFAAQNGFTIDSVTGSNETKVGLPTALIVGVDYHIVKGFYANATYIQNVASRTRIGNSVYSQLTVTPRYETQLYSVGLPITYSTMNNSVKLGIGARISGFFFGSDDLLGLVSNSQYGLNFYVGGFVPINKRKLRDRDGDLVSNKKDKCPNEKGVLEMNGCPNPDKDGDGVLDKDDKCVDVAGTKTAAGCPDADLDSVADAEDRCPQEAGLTGMMGCPDRDGDGIADIDDNCPDLAGLAQYKGCPDTDNDGIPDNEDDCPEAQGPPANNGCPDSDNDGIADNEDKCPQVAGTRSNFGCPEVSVEVKKRLAFAATAIQFETGKAVIKKQSYSLLDEIVKILNDYPDYIMTIDGHTDNVGSDELNLRLSKERAQSVKDYFVSKGVADERLVANGYGESQPVAPNNTAAGRAKNRRVDMDLKLKE